MLVVSVLLRIKLYLLSSKRLISLRIMQSDSSFLQCTKLQHDDRRASGADRINATRWGGGGGLLLTRVDQVDPSVYTLNVRRNPWSIVGKTPDSPGGYDIIYTEDCNAVYLTDNVLSVVIIKHLLLK